MTLDLQTRDALAALTPEQGEEARAILGELHVDVLPLRQLLSDLAELRAQTNTGGAAVQAIRELRETG